MRLMKTIIGALLLALGTIGFVSCSQEEDNAMMQESGKLLKIRTSIADTRNVITSTTFHDGDEIGICVTTPDGQAYTDHSLNIRATYSGGNWKLDRDVTLTDQEAIVYAYYPYDKEATDSIDINLTPGFMNRPGQTDYLQGSCQEGVNINSTTANIRFNHALARVTLAVKKGANDVGKGVISAARIENNLLSYSGQYVGEQPTTRDKIIATSGKMSIKTGKKRNITSTEDYFIEVPVNCTINTLEAQNIDILLLPVSYSSVQVSTWRGYGVSVVLTIDGGEYKFPLEAKPYDNEGTAPESSTAPMPGGYSWEAGQQYTYPITINRSTIPIPDSNGYEGIDMGILSDNGNTLYWGTYNIGVESVESYGELYCWGDPTGEKTSEYYDEEYNAEYDFSPENISSTEYDIARAKWGGKWRIPTESEWKRLLDVSTIKQDVVLNTNGTRITSSINGNSIFLPSAGYYNHKSSMSGSGNWELTDYTSRGAYWSSTRDFQHAFAATFSGGIYAGWKAPLAGRYSVRAVLGD